MMNNKLQVSMVSYLNSKPFLLGLELSGLMDDIELHLEVPAKTAEKLLAKQVDVALVPVATLPNLPDVKMFTKYCIGANKRVDSVYLFSQCPIHEIERVYLDSHSRTSCNLVRILLKEYWKQDVEFVCNVDVSSELVHGNQACLMIGDKALLLRNSFSYAYDLATAWYNHTHYPFVFAGWVTADHHLHSNWEHQLNQAFSLGLKHMNSLVPLYQDQYPNMNLKDYFSTSIDYHYNEEKEKSLQLFLQKMTSLESETQCV